MKENDESFGVMNLGLAYIYSQEIAVTFGREILQLLQNSI